MAALASTTTRRSNVLASKLHEGDAMAFTIDTAAVQAGGF